MFRTLASPLFFRLPLRIYIVMVLFFAAIGQLYIFNLLDIFHYKFFQDTTVIISSPYGGIGSGSFSSSKSLLSPYFFLLEFVGVDLEQYGRYSGVDFFFPNFIFCLINTVIFFGVARFYSYSRLLITSFAVFFLYLLYVPYIGVPGKETNTLLLGSILFFALYCRSRIGLVFAVFLILAYASLGRYYYVVFLVVYGALFYIRGRLARCLLIAFGVLLFFLLVSIPEVKIVLLLARPDIADITNSFIYLPLVDDSSLNIFLNRVFLFFSMCLPYQLLAGAKYWPYFIYGFFSSFVVFCSLVRGRRERLPYLCGLVVLSFYVAQALFEPDYGSVFRHRAFVLPFWVYLISWWFLKVKVRFVGVKVGWGK